MNDPVEPLKNKDIEPTVVRPTNPALMPQINPAAPLETAAEPVVLAKTAASEPESDITTNVDKHGGFKDFLSTVGILATALVVALLMIMFVFRSYQVDGPSMESTLQNSDKLIIWKVPRTWARITHHAYIPNRGDVIIFSESGLSQFGQTDTKQLIKRVVGLPGERVVVRDGYLTIYNKAYPGGFQPDKTLPYGKVIPTTSGDIDITIAKGQVFVCGDNRPDSLDSRAFGPIDANQILGKLVLRVFPLSQAKPF